MNTNTKQFWVAVASLVGAIVGVGIFGVPYVISQVGAVPALIYFAVLGGIQALQSIFFAEAAIASEEDHGLPGLATKYLGRSAGRIGGVALVLGYWASLTAYVVVGGTFLAVILQPLIGGSVMTYALVWGMIGALVVRYGMKTVSRFEFIGTVALVLALTAILGTALPHVQASNMPAFDWIDPIIPYGVILFSLAGLTAIPEMEGIVGRRPKDYRRAVLVGTLIATGITMAFGYVVWGVSGYNVTKDAVTGLQAVLGSGIAVPVAVAGFLAVATSYFATASNVKDAFQYDFRLRPSLAWSLAVMPPIGIYLLGGRDFLNMIGLSGAVFGGVAAVLVGLLYLKIRRNGLVKQDPLKIHSAFAYFSIVLLGIGIFVEASDYIRKILSD